MPDLLALDHTDELPEDLIGRCGEVLATYDDRTQDSGNVSWIVRSTRGDLFVKTAGLPGPPRAGVPVPALDHPDRIALLRNAVRIAASTTHPAISRLRHVVESPTGPMLVYDRATGELLHESRDHRSDPSTAYQRFACSPAGTRLRVFEQLLDAHLALEEAGWIACDLYDGCLLVDIATAHLTLIDLDNYRRGDTVNDRGRMFGSTRFMAPEEFELGAPIDFRTTVFTLGRLIRHFGTGLREDLVHFCGTPAQADVVARATEPERGSRFSSVAELSAAWNAAS